MEKLPLSLVSKLPYKLKVINKLDYRYTLKDNDSLLYTLYILNKQQYLSYLELIKSKVIEKCIYELIDKDRYCLLFSGLLKNSEELVIMEKMLPLLEDVFNDFKFSIKLKKEHVTNFNNIYKVLDNKFSYLETRIREIETSPFKDDISWVILSKYHIILDAKMYLYDLQQDMFSFIDKTENVDYGIIFKNIDKGSYKNGLIEPKFDLYYGPLGALIARFYLYFDHLNIDDFLVKKIANLDVFNAKYFCFMCLYIYILNIRLEILVNSYNISSYLAMTKRIFNFIKKYGGYVKK